MARPNIVFYFADQQRADTMGVYGQPLPVTPHLDALAAQGVVFDHAYTCQPVCGPARACLQTGLYATQCGCHVNGLPPDFANTPMLAEYFNRAGYDTAYVGKWHLATDKFKGIDYRRSAVPPERRGGWRDYWMASDVLEFTSHGYNGYVYNRDNERVYFTGYRADCINAFAVDFVRNYEKENPFFLFVSQIEPHHQNDHKRFEGPDGSKERFGHFTPPGDLLPGQGDWEAHYPDYLGCCHSLDANVGRLVDSLKAKGLWENTILIYTADHGSHFCTRNGEYKRSCHDASLHIPLIITGPGIPKGKRIPQNVSLLDLPATLMALMGEAVPPQFAGRDLQPLWQEENPDWDENVFVQISESQVGRALRTPRWTYSVRDEHEGNMILYPDAEIYYEDFLYDNEADPHQQHNLAADPAYEGVRAELRRILKQKMREAGEREPEIRPYADHPARR